MNNHCRNIKVVKGEKQQLRSRTKSNCCFSYLIIIIARRFHKSLLTHSPALCIPVTLRQTPLRNANIVIISISYRLKFIVVHIDFEQLNSSSAEATASCQFATQLNYFVRRSINNYCRDTILLNCAECMTQNCSKLHWEMHSLYLDDDDDDGVAVKRVPTASFCSQLIYCLFRTWS